MKRSPAVLHEDNHLLVLNKPAELPTMGVAPEQPSLFRWASEYIKQKYHKPGNVYLGVVSRLDSVASGAIVFARTSKAAARLSEQFRNTEVEKIYWAIVSPGPEKAHDQWSDPLRKDERQQRMTVVHPNAPGAQMARLQYSLRAQTRNIALLEVQLETGRKHQIRVQCASRGCPIVGDRKYGSTRPFPAGIALHSHSLAFTHPTRGERMQFTAPVPAAWTEYATQVHLEL